MTGPLEEVPAGQAAIWVWLARIAQMRPIVLMAGATFWTLFGGIVTLAAMRIFLVDQLHAEAEVRRTSVYAITAKVDTMTNIIAILRERQDSLEQMNAIQRKAICLDHTRTQQQTIGLECPQYLYRGAP